MIGPLAVAMAVFFVTGTAWAGRPAVEVAPQIDESLTLSKGKTELGFGGDFLQKRTGDDWYGYPLITMRYGITDDLELVPLGFIPTGIRYRFLNQPQKGLQMACTARMAGGGDAESADTAFISWEFAVEGKLRLDREVALTWYAGNYRSEFASSTADTLDLSAGLLISLGPPAALETTYTYSFQNGLGKDQADAFGVTLLLNVEPGTQVYLATTGNNLTRNQAFRLYHLRNISQVYTVGFKFVF